MTLVQSWPLPTSLLTQRSWQSTTLGVNPGFVKWKGTTRNCNNICILIIFILNLLTSIIIMLVFCVCVRLCVCVCLSCLRSSERDIIAPGFLHRHEELRLVSCTNHFLSRYDALLKRKRLWKFFQGYSFTHSYTPVKTSGYNGHNQSCLRNSRTFCVEGHTITLPKIYPFMNGFHLVYYNNTGTRQNLFTNA